MPHCCRLLNQGGLFSHLEMLPDVKVFHFLVSMMQGEKNFHLQRGSPFRSPPPVGWVGMPGLHAPPIVKRIIRLEWTNFQQ
ncbi:hypothetical protein Bca4012_035728 [Brassica carinata]